MFTGGATDVVNAVPVVVAVSPVDDVIVRVGVYVTPDDRPVMDLLVAVAPPYGVAGAPGIDKEYDSWLEDVHETVALVVVIEDAEGPELIVGTTNIPVDAAVPPPTEFTART